jgi:hypothetical protein
VDPVRPETRNTSNQFSALQVVFVWTERTPDAADQCQLHRASEGCERLRSSGVADTLSSPITNVDIEKAYRCYCLAVFVRYETCTGSLFIGRRVQVGRHNILHIATHIYCKIRTIVWEDIFRLWVEVTGCCMATGESNASLGLRPRVEIQVSHSPGP